MTYASPVLRRLLRSGAQALRGDRHELRKDVKLLRSAGLRGFGQITRTPSGCETVAVASEPGENLFADVWDPESRARGLGVLRETYRTLESAGLRPFIFYGTLLGACRDGDLIPWDGDFDLAVSLRDRRRLLRIMRFLPKQFHVAPHGDYNYKVFHEDGRPTAQHFLWPWVDIDFFETKSDGTVRFLNLDGTAYYCCDRSEVFPLSEYAFSGEPYAAPGNAELHLDRLYPGWKHTFRSSAVDHRNARTRASVSECSATDRGPARSERHKAEEA